MVGDLQTRLNVLETYGCYCFVCGEIWSVDVVCRQSETHSSLVDDLNRQHRSALDRLQQDKTRLEV